MITITDDDIGKEGRFTWRGQPCIVLRKLRGWKSPNFAIAYVDNSGSECAFRIATAIGVREKSDREKLAAAVRLGDDGLVRIPAPPRKLYIGVSRFTLDGNYIALPVHQTREAVERLIADDPRPYAIIEIPHPEDAP